MFGVTACPALLLAPPQAFKDVHASLHVIQHIFVIGSSLAILCIQALNQVVLPPEAADFELCFELIGSEVHVNDFCTKGGISINQST
mmetsp:Transcript_29690/g.78233  ORF Transcript_29690/g.78233 Transcript_29690/m.78233 type:complete len:87 (+) Transcript_29690:2402-2662(+)